ncbi:hypothetical protein J6590_070090 [Homalodisca vitripennis]|nr:hypothetical protein J6590_070090 [Homalodisca vitripennis]
MAVTSFTFQTTNLDEASSSTPSLGRKLSPHSDERIRGIPSNRIERYDRCYIAAHINLKSMCTTVPWQIQFLFH